MSCKNVDWDTDNSVLRDFRVPFGTLVLLPHAVFWTKKPGAWFSFHSHWCKSGVTLLSLTELLWGKLMSSRLESDFLNTGCKAIIKFEITLKKICCAPLLTCLGGEEECIQHRDTFSPSFLTILICLLKFSVLPWLCQWLFPLVRGHCRRMKSQQTYARPLISGVCSVILVPWCLKSLLGLKSGMIFSCLIIKP